LIISNSLIPINEYWLSVQPKTKISRSKQHRLKKQMSTYKWLIGQQAQFEQAEKPHSILKKEFLVVMDKGLNQNAVNIARIGCTFKLSVVNTG